MYPDLVCCKTLIFVRRKKRGKTLIFAQRKCGILFYWSINSCRIQIYFQTLLRSENRVEWGGSLGNFNPHLHWSYHQCISRTIFSKKKTGIFAWDHAPRPLSILENPYFCPKRKNGWWRTPPPTSTHTHLPESLEFFVFSRNCCHLQVCYTALLEVWNTGCVEAEVSEILPTRNI